jgi:O-antigen biosynthesis protein
MRPLHPQELILLARARTAARAPAVERQPTVTVLLLSLDRLHLTQRCIESIYAYADYPFELLIHDDGSQPETLAYLRALRSVYRDLRLVECSTPLGWAAARNQAFAQIRTDYILSLDNDIVCHPGWLRECVACAVRHDADFVAPLRLEPDGRVWSFAAELIRTSENTVLEIARWFHDLPLERVQTWFADTDVTTNFVAGGAGLFSRAAFQACGGFAEDYRIGFEDMDFCLKLAARGYTVWATVRAVLTHDDAWCPQTDADVTYARARYDPDVLRAAGALFKARWGVDVLPDKYVQSLAQRLQSKLDHAP